MTSISNLFNHFMSLVGLNHYNKSESDDKYATKSHNHSEYLTSHQDITGKLDKNQGSTNKNKNVVTDGNGVITTEDKPTIPTKTSELTNDSNFLTSHQSLANYVTTSDSRLSDARTPTSHEHSTSEVKDNSAYTNIGSSVNATQKTINDKINTAIGLKANSSNVYTKSETYTQSEITTAISNAVSNLQLFEVVTSLPTTNIKTNRLYLIVNGETITNNSYDVYLRVNNDWEQLDSLEFDISNFYNKTEVDTLLGGKVNTSDSRLSDSRTPKSHTHGNISNTGTLSGQSKNVVTDSNGAITTEDKPIIPTKTSDLTNDGDGTNVFVKNNDSRLSNARTPTSHTHTFEDLDYILEGENGNAILHADNGNIGLFDYIINYNPNEGIIYANRELFCDADGNIFALYDEIPDVSGKENISNKSSNIITDTGSTTKYPTVQAVENYVNNKIDASFKVEIIQNYSVQDLEDDYGGTDGNAFGMYIYDEDLNYDANTIYLLHNNDLVYGEGSYYNEYILINDTGQYPVFELLGTTQMDLSNYISKQSGNSNILLANGSTIPSSTFAASGHNHNDLYYTESEVNSLLNSKLNTADFATQFEAIIDSLISEAQS